MAQPLAQPLPQQPPVAAVLRELRAVLVALPRGAASSTSVRQLFSRVSDAFGGGASVEAHSAEMRVEVDCYVLASHPLRRRTGDTECVRALRASLPCAVAPATRRVRRR
jgi:hypothetical protein